MLTDEKMVAEKKTGGERQKGGPSAARHRPGGAVGFVPEKNGVTKKGTPVCIPAHRMRMGARLRGDAARPGLCGLPAALL